MGIFTRNIFSLKRILNMECFENCCSSWCRFRCIWFHGVPVL